MHLGAPQLHHALAVRLLGAGDLDHVDGAFQAEHGTGERQRAPPLTGAGLGRQAADTGLLVVVGLRNRGVRLVRPGRGNPFVFVIDLGRRAERLFQTVGTEQRRRPPQLVNFTDFVGDIDPALRRHLLLDQRHRENGQHFVRGDRLHGPRADHRRQRAGHIGNDVVPLTRDLVFRQAEFW